MNYKSLKSVCQMPKCIFIELSNNFLERFSLHSLVGCTVDTVMSYSLYMNFLCVVDVFIRMTSEEREV